MPRGGSERYPAWMSVFARLNRVVAILVLVMCVASGVLTSRARGQGTSGLVTDPIGLIALTQLLESTGVKYREVYEAVEKAHVSYLAACAGLREGKIVELRKRMDAMSSTGEPPRDAVETQRVMDLYAAVMMEYEQLDRNLFASIATACDLASRTGVERARATRERTLLQPSEMMGNGLETTIDVAVIVRSLNWQQSTDGSALLGACERALGDFDDRQPKLLRKALVKSLAISVEFTRLLASGALTMDELSAIAPDGTSRASPEALVKLFAPVAEVRKALHESESRAYRSVRDVLVAGDAVRAREFRLKYLSEAYRSVSLSTTNHFESQAAATLRLKRLTDDQRTAIRSIVGQWRPNDDRLIDEQVAVVDRAAARTNGVPWGFDGDISQELHDEQQAIEEKQSECAGTAFRAIESIVGADLPAMLETLGSAKESDLFASDPADALSRALDGSIDAGSGPDRASASREPAPDGVWFSTRMDDAWMDRIASAVGIGAASRATLESLKLDYWSAWDERIAPAVELMSRCFDIHWGFGSTASSHCNVLSNEADVARWITLSQTTQRDVRALENQFFADVQSAVAPPERAATIELLRVGRVCDERFTGLNDRYDIWHAGEANANAVLAATSVSLTPDECARVAQALAPALAELQVSADGLRKFALEAWRRQHASNFMWIEYQRANDPSKWEAVAAAQREDADRLRTAGVAASKARASAERAAFVTVMSVIPEAARSRYRTAYLLAAYYGPAGVDDSATDALTRAFALNDLTASQHGALEVARSDYIDEHDAALLVLLQPAESEQNAAMGTMQGWLEQRLQAEQLARCTFARTAAREKAMLRIRTTLSEDQLRRAAIK